MTSALVYQWIIFFYLEIYIYIIYYLKYIPWFNDLISTSLKQIEITNWDPKPMGLWWLQTSCLSVCTGPLWSFPGTYSVTFWHVSNYKGPLSNVWFSCHVCSMRQKMHVEFAKQFLNTQINSIANLCVISASLAQKWTCMQIFGIKNSIPDMDLPRNSMILGYS